MIRVGLGRYILGIDPGFRSLGWALVSIPRINLITCGVIRTEPLTKKKDLTKSSDNERRARDIGRELWRLTFRTYGKPLLVARENQSIPRSSATGVQLGYSYGIVSLIAAVADCPVLETSPKELKRQVTGSGSATKAEVFEGVKNTSGFSGLERILKNKKIPPWQWEHPADACGAVICALNTDIYRMVKSGL